MPVPGKKETQDDFISRCMGDDEANSSFPNQDQRAAFCFSQWREHHNNVKQSCGCNGLCNDRIRQIKANLLLDEIRKVTFNNREVLIVPVIMARADVVMNDSIIPVEEFAPAAWNGRPVTVEHPIEDGGYVTANRPDKIETQTIGQLFNTRIEGVKLIAEAWIDIKAANKIEPSLIARILAGEPIDVSTGYFSTDDPISGEINGRAYTVVNRDIKPDHLALLPSQDGACSWADGCGVRSQQRREKVKINAGLIEAALDHVRSFVGKRKASTVEIGPIDPNAVFTGEQVQELVTKISDNAAGLRVSERGNDDDRRQMIADLISREESPFIPDDEDSLRMMSPNTLKRMRDDYCSMTMEEDEKMKDNAAANGLPKTAADLQKVIDDAIAAREKDQQSSFATLIANAVNEAVNKAFTAEDRAALALANQVSVERKKDQIDKIVANTTMTREQADKLDAQTLELIANSVLPAPNFAGRSAPVVNSSDDDPAVKAMVPPTIMSVFTEMQNRKKGAN